ncbi:flavin reductase family protein [Microvirga zambiensis]|uniref:flavin reductase family protein n=1 Tax=Microvirga zambiensis TaxID=1402137 RepID=UPI00191D8F48|nr:flavin reductase family protein [Microvirga zambiensis]
MAQVEIVCEPRFINSHSFRTTMSKFATGVAVLTSLHEGQRFGMTINSLTSVSLDPHQILVCLNQGSATGNAIRSSGRFAVNLLDRDQQDVARSFVGRDAKRFDCTACTTSVAGLPLVEGALAYLVCRVSDILPSGDHDIVIGDVVECWQRDGEPLVFYSGAYGSFESDALRLRACGTSA